MGKAPRLGEVGVGGGDHCRVLSVWYHSGRDPNTQPSHRGGNHSVVGMGWDVVLWDEMGCMG